MTNPNFTQIDDYRDVESLNAYENMQKAGKSKREIIEILQQKSRDNARTPMQWSSENQAGFTTGQPWISVADNYQTINAEKVVEDSNSIFHHYQKLIALRKKYDIIVYGDYELLLEDHQRVFVYQRKYENETLLVVSNFYGEEVKVNLQLEVAGDREILLSNYPDSKKEI